MDDWSSFVIGLCMFLLICCILYWERRADQRWANKYDVRLPRRNEPDEEFTYWPPGSGTSSI